MEFKELPNLDAESAAAFAAGKKILSDIEALLAQSAKQMADIAEINRQMLAAAIAAGKQSF